MGAPESRRKIVGAVLRILFDVVENGRVFPCVGRPDRGVLSKSVSPPLKLTNKRLPALAEVVSSHRTVDVSNCCRHFTASRPFIEDDGSNVF